MEGLALSCAKAIGYAEFLVFMYTTLTVRTRNLSGVLVLEFASVARWVWSKGVIFDDW